MRRQLEAYYFVSEDRAISSNMCFLLLSTALRPALCVVVLTLLIKCVLDLIHRDARLVEFAKMLPGPYALPIVGNGDLGLASEKGALDLIDILQQYEHKFGPRYRLWFGKHLVVVLSDLDDLQVMFGSSKMLNKPKFADPAREFSGDGLFSAPLHVWKITRKELQPFFVKNEAMSECIPEMNRLIYKYVAEMKKHVDGEEFDLWDFLPELSFDIITRMLFDFELSPAEKSDINFSNCVLMAEETVLKKMFKPWAQFKLIDYFIFRGKREYYHAQMTKFMNLVLGKQSAGELSGIKSASGLSFLQTLQGVRTKIDVDKFYVRDEIVTIIGAGTETTAITLGFCILMIAMHTDVQTKLQEELRQRFGDDSRTADMDDINNLPYLDQVLKESQRRFTIVPLLHRRVDVDSKIGPYIYPEGTTLMISIINIHLNSEYYPNPLEFNPENFSPEAVSKRPKLTFMPFSLGPRNCVGKVLAELDMKLTLIALLRTYNFQTNVRMNEIQLIPGIAIVSANGYKVRISPRDPPIERSANLQT